MKPARSMWKSEANKPLPSAVSATRLLRSNSRSSTAWTSVPRAMSTDGRSGSRSMVRNRYSSGQVLKSAARDGDSEGGRGSAGASIPGPGVTSTVMP